MKNQNRKKKKQTDVQTFILYHELVHIAVELIESIIQSFDYFPFYC